MTIFSSLCLGCRRPCCNGLAPSARQTCPNASLASQAVSGPHLAGPERPEPGAKLLKQNRCASLHAYGKRGAGRAVVAQRPGDTCRHHPAFFQRLAAEPGLGRVRRFGEQ